MNMTKKPPHTQDDAQPAPSRRTVIKGLAGAAAAASALPPVAAQAARFVLPPPEQSGIDHIVVVMMENRSFDHMLGWVPAANGVQSGRSFTDTSGQAYDSFHLTKFENCANADPNHGYVSGRMHLADGAMNGFLLSNPAGDIFPIGYYTEADVPFYASVVQNWTICDRYFSGILSSTWPNRLYMHCGQTDRTGTGSNTIDTNSLLSILPTIWDRAAQGNVSARYYYNDAAYTALWGGGKYQSISFPFAQFQADAAAGTLPSISYVDPPFNGSADGVSSDDHPLADIRNGQLFLNTVYQTLTASPNWPNTLFIITYDEWGGFAEHVVPPLAPVTAHEARCGNVDVRHANGTTSAFLGFRVPCLLMGPRAYRGAVAHQQYDPNTILNLITWRFGLPGIGIRATTSGNIATALNFDEPPNLTLPPPVTIVDNGFGVSCASNQMADLRQIHDSYAEHFADLDKIKSLMIEQGFRMA